MNEFRSLAFTVALACSLGVASAQDEPAPAQDHSTFGRSVLDRGTRLSMRVGQMLSQAQTESDIIRITCLNDKLTQINANLRAAERRFASLQSAADASRRNHEHTVLTVLAQKFTVLDQEANQCVGQDMFETGTTRVTTEIDASMLPPEIPSQPPSILPPSNPTIPPPTSAGM